MKQKLIIIAISMVISSGSAVAESKANGTPNFFGNIDVGAIKHDSNTDVDGEAFEVSLGVKGAYKLEGFKVIYKIEGEVTNATNADDGKSDFEMKNAVVILPGPYGTFILGARVESGQQKEMYKFVDIFENNEAHSSSVSPIWAQGDEVSSMFGYNTPVYNGFYGALRVLTLDDDNDEDADAIGGRIIYSQGNLYLGAGHIVVSSNALPTSEDYKRSTLTAGYNFTNVDLGFTWEGNDEHPSGDFDVWGVAADVSLNDSWSAGVSYIDKDHDNNALDNDAVIGIVRNQLNENVYVYAEAADYSLSNLDNYSAGISVSF